METVVKELISKIDKGSVFDSHLIIDTVIKKHHDEYITFTTKNAAKGKKTEYAHGRLAKIIASFAGSLVKYLHSNSISYNVRGNISKCALWEKI